MSVSQAYLWESDGDGQWVTHRPGCPYWPLQFVRDGGQSARADSGIFTSRLVDFRHDARVLGERSAAVGRTWTSTTLLENLAPSGRGDINDLGQIVGTRRYTDGTPTYAVLWQRIDGQWTLTDLSVIQTLRLHQHLGNAHINNSGQVVGGAKLTTGEGAAFLYEDGVMYDLNQFLPARHRDGRCGAASESTTTAKSSVSEQIPAGYSPRVPHGHPRGDVLLHLDGQRGIDQGQQYRVEGDDVDRQRDDHGLEREGDSVSHSVRRSAVRPGRPGQRHAATGSALRVLSPARAPRRSCSTTTEPLAASGPSTR